MHVILIETFGCSDHKPFAGLSVIAAGDLSQLPPVGGKPVCAEYNNCWQNFGPLWKQLKSMN